MFEDRLNRGALHLPVAPAERTGLAPSISSPVRDDSQQITTAITFDAARVKNWLTGFAIYDLASVSLQTTSTATARPQSSVGRGKCGTLPRCERCCQRACRYSWRRQAPPPDRTSRSTTPPARQRSWSREFCSGRDTAHHSIINDRCCEAYRGAPRSYVAAMHGANFSGAHWWCASDIYTEHGSIPNYTWIPHGAPSWTVHQPGRCPGANATQHHPIPHFFLMPRPSSTCVRISGMRRRTFVQG